MFGGTRYRTGSKKPITNSGSVNTKKVAHSCDETEEDLFVSGFANLLTVRGRQANLASLQVAIDESKTPRLNPLAATDTPSSAGSESQGSSGDHPMVALFCQAHGTRTC